MEISGELPEKFAKFACCFGAIFNNLLNKNLDMIFTTIVEHNEQALTEIIGALNQFERDRFVAGVQAGKFTKYEIQQALDMVQTYQLRINIEGRALSNFAQTFIKEFATDNNKCYLNAEKYFRKISSTLCALKKVFKKTCYTSRKQLPEGAKVPSVFNRSALASDSIQLDMYGLESYDDMVQELYYRLDTLLSTATQILTTCQCVIEKEEAVRGDAEMLQTIYNESCNNLMCSVQECVKFMKTTKNVSENELMKRKARARSKEDFLKSEYHNVRKDVFKQYVWMVNIMKGHDDGLTEEETYLWPNDHEKAAEVKRVIANFDQLELIEGQEGKLDSEVIVEFLKWCKVELRKEKRLYQYFCSHYAGRYDTLAWTSVSGLRKSLREELSCSDESLAQSFEQRLKKLEAKVANVVNF